MINRLVAKCLTSEKDLFRRINVWAKGPLLARLLGDPLNGLNDPRLEKIDWNASVQYYPTQSFLFLSNTYHSETQCTLIERLVYVSIFETTVFCQPGDFFKKFFSYPFL